MPRVWFVTGTSSGIGLSIARQVLADGERLVATARNPVQAAGLLDLQKQYPSSQLILSTLDVTKADDITRSFKEAVEAFGRVDVVVNNAGYSISAEIEATSDKVARDQFEALFWGPVNVTRAAIKVFREVNPKGDGGLVINVSSAGGYNANPLLAFYNAGKFALEGFTEAFIKEMPPAWNIRGIILQPGGFETTWNKANEVPPHPAYPADAPSNVFRQLLQSPQGAVGDIVKAGKLVMKISKMDNPPQRIQMGTDSNWIAQEKAKSVARDAVAYAELAAFTNKDGVPADAVCDGLSKILKF